MAKCGERMHASASTYTAGKRGRARMMPHSPCRVVDGCPGDYRECTGCNVIATVRNENADDGIVS